MKLYHLSFNYISFKHTFLLYLMYFVLSCYLLLFFTLKHFVSIYVPFTCIYVKHIE